MPRQPKRTIRIFNEKEIRKIIETAMTINKSRYNLRLAGFFKLRNAMMIFLSYYLGLRPREYYAARLEYADMQHKSFFIPCGSNKMRYSDEVPIPAVALKPLKKYLSIRNQYFKDSQWLFPAAPHHARCKTGHLNRHTFNRTFKDITKKLGYYRICYTDSKGFPRGNISLYSLRHSFGTKAYQVLRDIPAVASLLRHRSPRFEATFRYIHYNFENQRRGLMEQLWENN